jgi:hypothetical protein
MLIAARALLGVSAEAVRQALPRGPGAEAETFGEAIVEADRHVHGHADSVARCLHEEVE